MKLFFVNPYPHHAYFSVLALSRVCAVEVVCPPLSIDFFFHRWKTQGLRLRYSTCSLFGGPFLVVAYWAKRLRLLSEHDYLRVFLFWADFLLRQKEDCLVYCYQDYLLPLMQRGHSQQIFVSEFIIQIPGDQPNSKSSVEAACLSKIVLAPTQLIIDELAPYDVQSALAPYGGDKHRYRQFRTDPRISDSTSQTSSKRSAELARDHPFFLIAARASSFRKGLDILLDALEALEHDFPDSDWAGCNVVICGKVSEPSLLQRLSLLSGSSSAMQKINVRAGQLSQDAYLALLNQADLFVMPSRLEGSSPAALEALWQGVPSILSPYCGVEMFESGIHGDLLRSNTASCLLKSLQDFISDSQRLHSSRLALQRDQHLFTWEPYMVAVAESVNEILNDPGSNLF